MSSSNSAYCPLCKKSVKLYWSENYFFRCPECEFLFRNSPVGDEGLKFLYQKSWQSPEDHTNETGGTDISLARQYVKCLCQSIHTKNLQGLKILDFGAGSGNMVVTLKENGANVIAIEPFGYDYISRLGIPVYRSLDDLSEENHIFDGVVSIDVIEHLTEPLTDLAKIKSRIIKNGWIFLSTPNNKSLNARVKRSNWREANKDGHLALYSPTSLSKSLSITGFSKIKRLSWNIIYDTNILVNFKDLLLRKILLDGELRYLAHRDE